MSLEVPVLPSSLPAPRNLYCESFATRFLWATPFNQLDPLGQCSALDWMNYGIELGQDLERAYAYQNGYQAAEQDSAALWANMSQVIHSLTGRSMADRYRSWGEPEKASGLDMRARDRGYAI